MLRTTFLLLQVSALPVAETDQAQVLGRLIEG
jgi:hypothetical protein